MAIFAIIQQPGAPSSANLPTAILTKYPVTNYAVGNGVWLVADSGTAVDVSNRIGVTPGEDAGSAMVLEIASYYGRANPAIWSWIKANWEGAPLV